MFRVENITVRYRGATADALRRVSCDVEHGQFIAIVGPNGSGKTTLLKVMLGIVKPDSGTVAVRSRPLSAWKRNELARLIGVVSQREETAFPLKVDQSVFLGRYPHLGALGSISPVDREAVHRALVKADVLHLKDRWTSSLSGGEWQRVRIARALAQEPEALVLDEPTANLDIRHEMEVFELARDLVASAGMTSVMVTHHVNLAARYADSLVVMKEGVIVASGPPSNVLNEQTLESVFDWPVSVTDWNGVPQFLPRSTWE